MNKTDLLQKVKALDGLSQEEKAYLINLVNTKKKYGLVWEDKPETVEEQLRQNLPVLHEVVEKRIMGTPLNDKQNAETKNLNQKQTNPTLFENGNQANPEILKISDADNYPNHILIEGDNLHALTALTFTHEGKIDVIYIDPPYNTGNKDFKYNDSFVDKEDSYRHSKWLSFMHKRLLLAKRLLSEKGVIFISIDDNEVSQLRLLCNQILGEDNFIAELIWKSKSGGAADAKFIATDHEYILVISNDYKKLKINLDSEATVTTVYNLQDEKGYYGLDRLDKQSLGYLKSLDFPIIGPDGKEYNVEHKNPNKKMARWRWGSDTVKERYNELIFKNNYVYTKNYQKDAVMSRSLLIEERFGRTRTGKTDLFEIMGENIFTSPKPPSILRYILKLCFEPSTILDFFAGSGTTLHATMQLNAEDGGHRQCILVTNNENNICEEVTYERNKRVIQGYTNAKGVAVAGLTNNNLRYYKSGFVGREPSLKNKRAITQLATELLCIKEDIYEVQKTIANYIVNDTYVKCFKQRNVYLLVLYDENIIEQIVEVMQQVIAADAERKIHFKVYVFSNGHYPYTEEFEEVLPYITLCALPDAIYKAYMHVLPKRVQKAMPILEDQTTEIMENQPNNTIDLFNQS